HLPQIRVGFPGVAPGGRMGLFPCPECGGEVSFEAVTCPKCGQPLHDFTAMLTFTARRAEDTPDECVIRLPLLSRLLGARRWYAIDVDWKYRGRIYPDRGPLEMLDLRVRPGVHDVTVQ